MPRPNTNTASSPQKRLLAVFTAAAVLISSMTNAKAQPSGERISLLRDSEIEHLLRDYARPVFKTARVGGTQGIDIVIMNDRGFNAFVADSRRIFITVGALLDSTTPNQVIGVLAHETGHIAGGHLARLRQQLQHAQNISIIGLLLGVAAIAAGAAGGASARDIGGAATGIAAGSAGLGMRTLLAYQRTEEQAADRAAINYLNATKQSGRGMIATFKRFAEQMIFSTRIVDPYVLSHPMPQDRIAALQELVEASPYKDIKDSAALQARHDLMRAKISGYLERADAVARRYPSHDTSLPARYARAVSASKNSALALGLKEMDGLIAAQPNNPYFHELKGQTLLENSRPKEALAPYRRAVALSPNDGLLRLGLGRALVATEDQSMMSEAITILERGLIQEPEAALGYRFLGIAYAKKGDEGRASLATAQGYFYEGKFPLAKQVATRAKALLPQGSPGWIKADDILNFKTPDKE